MNQGKFKKLYKLLDLHDESNRNVYIYLLFGALFVLSIFMRVSLIKFQDIDYHIFSNWYAFINIHGIHSFKYSYSQGFSNYNPPYTYFLYIAAILPISKIYAIKGLLILFDILLAVSVYFVTKIFKPDGYTAIIAALVTMYLPTVLITGVMWGQFDQLYVAFMLFSLYFGLKSNSSMAWMFFGIAIAVKFQAIFLLPVLVILCFKQIKWQSFGWAILSFFVLTLPPMLVGRSLGSLLNIYPSQSTLFNGQLTLNAPNIYQWVPNSAYADFYHAGIGLAVGATLMVISVAIIYKKYSKEEVLLAATLLLYLIPFLLPAMHERYFFPAGILSLLLVFINRKYVWVALSMQVVTILSYTYFLFHIYVMPMSVLAIAALGINFGLVMYYMSPVFTSSISKSSPKLTKKVSAKTTK